jgi:hypothetical protein
MAGELVPLVLVPRYTSYLGAFAFTTIGMEVTDYEKALVTSGAARSRARAPPSR